MEKIVLESRQNLTRLDGSRRQGETPIKTPLSCIKDVLQLDKKAFTELSCHRFGGYQ